MVNEPVRWAVEETTAGQSQTTEYASFPCLGIERSRPAGSVISGYTFPLQKKHIAVGG
jgi:hypothetical protein